MFRAVVSSECNDCVRLNSFALAWKSSIKRMPEVREYVSKSLGESVGMLPGFSLQTLLVSTALIGARQDAG